MEDPLLLYVPQISRGIMDEEEEVEDDEELGTPSSSSSSSSCDSAGSNDSSSSELADDATSKNVDQSSSQGGPYEMSSLMAQLPFKRGLSRHFQGKSQSFTSLASARCLEDLAKPERPYCRKRLKPCRSYGAGLDGQKPHSPVNGCSKAIAKRTYSRGSLPTSVVARRPGFLGSGRPPVAPPHRPSGFSTQALLFA